MTNTDAGALMPAANTGQDAPTIKIYTGLEGAYQWFNKHLFQDRLPGCLITMQRKRSAYGYFAGNRFASRSGATIMDEIALNPDHFAKRSEREILSTLVHEMAHLEQHHEGKPGKNGYHNKAWGGLMDRVGLCPSDTGEPDGKRTGTRVSHYIIEGGPYDLAHKAFEAQGGGLDCVDLWGGDEEKKKRAKTKAASKTPFLCEQCNQKAWAKPDAKLICGECGEPMVCEAPDEEEGADEE